MGQDCSKLPQDDFDNLSISHSEAIPSRSGGSLPSLSSAQSVSQRTNNSRRNSHSENTSGPAIVAGGESASASASVSTSRSAPVVPAGVRGTPAHQRNQRARNANTRARSKRSMPFLRRRQNGKAVTASAMASKSKSAPNLQKQGSAKARATASATTRSSSTAATAATSETQNASNRGSIFRVRSRKFSLRRFRVNSKKEVMRPVTDEDMPKSPRARTSTYSNVKEAVMYNLSEAERSRHDQSVPMGVIGLKNLGNTCFINSSLQCLSATIPLTDYFLGYDYRSEINHDNFLGTGGKLVVAYAELMKQMWLGQRSMVEPRDFKQQLATFAPQFVGYHQHDAQELLAFLLDGIHEDLNRVKKKPYVEDKDCDGTNDEEDAIESWKNYLKRNKSLVVDLFQGQLRNTCKCLTCGHVNIRFEPFMYLSLPITDKCRSLQDCIDLYLHQEVLKGSDQWYCEKCKKHRNATKKSDLWIVPPILIVHLKRFRYNDSGKVGSKNDASIQYPVEQWDLSDLVMSSGSLPPVYDLYAVSNHMGGLGGGHYTALGLNRFNDEWYEFNDSRYKIVDESIHKNHTKTAYLLFYNRSEGDSNQPLNERSPLIRRQSVSRPDLWPHRQVAEREKVRDFARPHRRTSEYDMPDLNQSNSNSSRARHRLNEPSSSNQQSTSLIREVRTIARGKARAPRQNGSTESSTQQAQMPSYSTSLSGSHESNDSRPRKRSPKQQPDTDESALPPKRTTRTASKSSRSSISSFKR